MGKTLKGMESMTRSADEIILAFTQLPIQLLDNLNKYDDCMSVETSQVRGIINRPIFIRQIIKEYDKTKKAPQNNLAQTLNMEYT